MNSEFRPSRFEILPVIIKNLLIINILVFVAQLTFDGVQQGGDLEVKTGWFTNLFALHNFQSSLFRPWQLVTHMFLHGGLMHIFGNMFALYMFGAILENIWGPKRFLIFYLVCGIGAACLHMGSLIWENHQMLAMFNQYKTHPSLNGFTNFAYNYIPDNPEITKMLTDWKSDPSNPGFSDDGFSIMSYIIKTTVDEPTLGASGAVFGCLAAFGYLFPNTYIYLYFFVPLKAKWFVIGYITFELLMAFQHSAGGTVAHFAHLGGALVGFLLVYFWNKTNRKTFY
jgi:membrane associated rhomboid family serine protease